MFEIFPISFSLCPIFYFFLSIFTSDWYQEELQMMLLFLCPWIYVWHEHKSRPSSKSTHTRSAARSKINNKDYNSKLEENTMKRVTITYTRQSLDTPWYWQVAPSKVSPINNFILENSSRIETHAYNTGDKCIVIYIFNDEQIEEEFRSLIIDDIINSSINSLICIFG